MPSSPSELKRSTPGPSRLLTQEQILRKALDVLRRDGVEGLSQRRLAGELGVTPMTLYRYYPSKDALLDAIADRALVVPEAADPGVPWFEQLRQVLTAVHDSFQRSPGVAELMAVRSMTGPGVDALRERILGLMVGAGVDGDEALQVLGVINRYLLGCAMVEGRTRRADDSAEANRLSALDPVKYPTLTGLGPRYTAHDSAEAGLAGLDLVIAEARRRAERND